MKCYMSEQEKCDIFNTEECLIEVTHGYTGLTVILLRKCKEIMFSSVIR
jgi:hypothetical protein